MKFVAVKISRLSDGTYKWSEVEHWAETARWVDGKGVCKGDQ